MADLKQELKSLILTVKRMVDEGLKQNKLKPSTQLYHHRKPHNFKYEENGDSSCSYSIDDIEEKSWGIAIYEVEKRMKKAKEYDSALKKLSESYPDNQHCEDCLRTLITNYCGEYLEDRKNHEKISNKLLKMFIKDMNREPVCFWSDVEVHGVFLKKDKIQISKEVMIRRVKKKDLEEKIPYHALPYTTREMRSPSLILYVQTFDDTHLKLQELIHKAICLLTLYKVGGVIGFKYKLNADSLLGRGGGTSTKNSSYSFERYFIEAGEDEALKKFFKVVGDKLPKSFYWSSRGHMEPALIAYKRYCDALLTPGNIEKRMTDAMMGFEALFLGDDDNQELSHRLALRITKLMCSLGVDAKDLVRKVKDAYRIRSIFSHGGYLNHKRKQKFERRNGDLRDFLLEFLNYLRISILIFILMPVEKDYFLDLLDDSLIFEEKRKNLEGRLSGWKDLLLS